MQGNDPPTIQDRALADIFEFRTFSQHATRTQTHRGLLTKMQDVHGHRKLPGSAAPPSLVSLIPGHLVACDVINLFASYWREAGPGVDADKVFIFDSMLSKKLDVDPADFLPRPLLSWFPRQSVLKNVENFFIPYNNRNIHWLGLDISLALREHAVETITVFDSARGTVAPTASHGRALQNLNTLLDLAAAELSGWRGARAGTERVVTPHASMPQQTDGISCGVFLMLSMAQRCMPKSSRQYTCMQFSQEHIDAVRLFLMCELCAHVAVKGFQLLRDRAAREMMLHSIAATPLIRPVMDFPLHEMQNDPWRRPGLCADEEQPRCFLEDWGTPTLHQANVCAREVVADFFASDLQEWQTFKHGKVLMSSVLMDDRHGNTRRVEHGFQGSTRQIPTNLLNHDIGTLPHRQCMSVLRSTWLHVCSHAKNMVGPQQTVEYSMFVTGRVKQALELSGAASRVIVTSAGSCAMLHFDSMVATSPSSSVSILSTQLC